VAFTCSRHGQELGAVDRSHRACSSQTGFLKFKPRSGSAGAGDLLVSSVSALR
jgi:hypothetical protein